MELDCAESRCLVKNGEDCLGVPAMHQLKAECKMQNAELPSHPTESGALPMGEPSRWKSNTNELNARVEPCKVNAEFRMQNSECYFAPRKASYVFRGVFYF